MAKKSKSKAARVLRWMAYLLGLGALLGLLLFFLRIWSWEPAELSRELLLETSRTLGCKLQVQSTELRRFPFPRALWQGASLSFGEDLHARVKTVVAGPDLLSMAIGRIRISYLELGGLEASHEPWEKLLEGLWGAIPRSLQVPFFDMRLSGAKVETSLAGEEPLLLTNLRGRLNRKLSGAGLSLSFDLKGAGKDMLLRGVALEFSAPGDLGSAIAGRISVQEPFIFFTARLRGLSSQGFHELLLASPSLDLASARTLMQLFPKTPPLASDLLGLFQAGKLWNLELKIPGKKWGLLGESPQMEARGRLEEARLLLPNDWGVLRGLEARVGISGSTLELSSLRAHAPAGSIREGYLRLDLASPQGALFAELQFEADLRELHRILEERVAHEPWGSQIRALYRVRGKARGKLLAEGPLVLPRLGVEIEELNFLARHKAFPYAIEIQGGRILAGSEGMVFQGLRGTLGSSGFSEVSGSLDVSGEPWLDLQAGTSVLELEEIWALLRDAAWDLLENLDSLEGRLRIRKLEINGPLLEPRAWKGRGWADLEGRVAAHLLWIGVDLKEAELEFTEESISLKRAELEAGGESLYLEAEFLHWLEHDQRVEARISGHIGPQVWGVLREPLTRFTGVSWRELPRARLLPSRFVWSPEAVSLEAQLSWEEKMHVSVDLGVGKEGLRIRQLQLQDDESKAFFSLEAAPDKWELALDGHIWGVSLDFFIEENLLGRGWVKGRAKIRKDASEPPALTGQIMAGAMVLARFMGGRPWELVQGKLTAQGGEIILEDALIKRLDREFLLRGKGSLWKGGLQVKATLETISLAWEELGEITQELMSGLGTSLFGSLGLRVGQLQVGETFLRPFHADLELDSSTSQLDLRYALVCGVNLSGTIQAAPGPSWSVHAVARDLDLNQFLGCLGVSSIGFAGKADLDGEIRGQGFEFSSVERVGGSLEVMLHKGEIQAPRLWSGVLEALRRLPELRDWPKKAAAGAIPLDKGRTTLEFGEGNLTIKELWLEGSLMQILLQGEVDLFSGRLQLEALLEPKGIKPKGSKTSQVQKPLALLALEGSLEEPRVHTLQAGQMPRELLDKLKKTQVTKKKAGTVRKN